jgi:hypothetical protein
MKYPAASLDKEVMNPCVKRPIIVHCLQMTEDFEVETHHGWTTGKAGDYIMRGPDGELYPCEQGVFDRTYNIVRG